MSLPTASKFERLRRYGLEFTVVFFGVWLGLLAENYRESRLEREAERVSLTRLHGDLSVDHRDMVGNLRRAQDGLAAAKWILERADQSEVDPDSLAGYLFRLQLTSAQVTNTSEYTALKGAGRINIIRDTELRQRLTELYEHYPFVGLLHDREDRELRAAMEEIATHVRLGGWDGVAFPPLRLVGSPSEVLSADKFLIHVAQLAFYRAILSRDYERLLGDVEAVRESIIGNLGPEYAGEGG